MHELLFYDDGCTDGILSLFLDRILKLTDYETLNDTSKPHNPDNENDILHSTAHSKKQQEL
jgi:hypothetical protein